LLADQYPQESIAMTYNQVLKDRVKTARAHVPHVEEKQMFGGIAFMVNRKICISVGRDRIMCRIDPAIHELALKRKGCETVRMRGEKTEALSMLTKMDEG